MVPQFAVGLFGLWPLFIFPVLGDDAPDVGEGTSQVEAAASTPEEAPRFIYSIACVEGRTGEKRFASVDELCGALRSEQVCAETAGFVADVQGCP
jgi:hypothetical protein